MLTVQQNKSVLAMSSQEISALVNSRHDSVKRSVERLASLGTIQLPPLVEVKNGSGHTVEVYMIGKRDSYIVVAQLSPEFTAALVDRWQELETKQPVHEFESQHIVQTWLVDPNGLPMTTRRKKLMGTKYLKRLVRNAKLWSEQ